MLVHSLTVQHYDNALRRATADHTSATSGNGGGVTTESRPTSLTAFRSTATPRKSCSSVASVATAVTSSVVVDFVAVRKTVPLLFGLRGA